MVSLVTRMRTSATGRVLAKYEVFMSYLMAMR